MGEAIPKDAQVEMVRQPEHGGASGPCHTERELLRQHGKRKADSERFLPDDAQEAQRSDRNFSGSVAHMPRKAEVRQGNLRLQGRKRDADNGHQLRQVPVRSG